MTTNRPAYNIPACLSVYDSAGELVTSQDGGGYLDATKYAVKNWADYCRSFKRCKVDGLSNGWLVHTEGGPVRVGDIDEARAVAGKTGCTIIF